MAGLRLVVPIRGVVRRYKYLFLHAPLIGAAIADTKWFNPSLYVIENEWRGGNVGRDLDFSERLLDTIGYREIRECPLD